MEYWNSYNNMRQGLVVSAGKFDEFQKLWEI